MPAVSASPTPFQGLWIPLVTPFHDGAVDHPALAKLTTRLATQGVAGLVACGSTGEAAALDEAEQLAVLETVLGAAQGLPVVMGLSGYHLGQTLEWVRTLAQYPVAGLLVPAPHYIRPSQEGLLHWFRTLADASTVPLIVYDIPYRTGASLTTETLLMLADHPRIRAIKDCGGNTGQDAGTDRRRAPGRAGGRRRADCSRPWPWAAKAPLPPARTGRRHVLSSWWNCCVQVICPRPAVCGRPCCPG